MATMESANKVCIVCGTDVAGKPRVKDAAGRYMCAGECQQKAEQASAARAKARAAPPVAAPRASAPPVVKSTAPPAGRGEGSLMGDLISGSPMVNAVACSGCGNPMPGGAMVCTRCGYNTKTGKALKTAVIREKEVKQPKVKGSGRYSSRYSSGASDWGPSFEVLFLIVAGSLSLILALGFVHPAIFLLGVLATVFTLAVGSVWGMVNAVQDGEWLALVLGYKWLYYMFIESERKWSRSLYLGSLAAGLVGYVIFRMGLESALNAIPN